MNNDVLVQEVLNEFAKSKLTTEQEVEWIDFSASNSFDLSDIEEAVVLAVEKGFQAGYDEGASFPCTKVAKRIVEREEKVIRVDERKKTLENVFRELPAIADIVQQGDEPELIVIKLKEYKKFKEELEKSLEGKECEQKKK